MIRYFKGCIPRIRNTNTIFTMDTENSTGFFDSKGNVHPYTWIAKETFYDDKEVYSLCYIWQVGVNDMIFYGRYLSELKECLQELSEKADFKKIIYVHNLSHDIMFLMNIINFDEDNVFCRKPYKIIKAFAPEYNVEFRCSYFLTRLSLANWGKQIGLDKAVGDLDYNLIRTPLTPLTKQELFYCERDVQVMYKGLLRYREKYGTMENIPLTQTGEVRLAYKQKIKNNLSLQKTLQKLNPTEEEYTILKKIFRGGDTHANYLHVNKVLKNVHSYDIASSYPFALISERYPMSPWKKLSKLHKKDIDSAHFAYMLKVEITDLKESHSCHYLSESKCEAVTGEVLDNGRLLKADKVVTWVTEIDLEIIEKCYNCGKIKILDAYKSRKKRLPKELVLFILELFHNKTTLDGVSGKEALYLQAKQIINSLYGMCVTDMINDVIELHQDAGIYTTEKANFNDSVQPFLEKPYKNFVSYSWGVWCTAYARYNLWTAILHIGDNVVYYDTDSVKYLGNYDTFFNEYNKAAYEKAMTLISDYNVDIKAVKPSGKVKVLGSYEDEGNYLEFKTLGAKRYAFKKLNEQGNTMTGLTVSGVSKKAVKYLYNNLNNFNDGMEFPMHLSGKMISIKNFNQPFLIWKDYTGKVFKSDEKYGSALKKSSYHMNMCDDFVALLGSLYC